MSITIAKFVFPAPVALPAVDVRPDQLADVQAVLLCVGDGGQQIAEKPANDLPWPVCMYVVRVTNYDRIYRVSTCPMKTKSSALLNYNFPL